MGAGNERHDKDLGMARETTEWLCRGDQGEVQECELSIAKARPPPRTGATQSQWLNSESVCRSLLSRGHWKTEITLLRGPLCLSLSGMAGDDGLGQCCAVPAEREMGVERGGVFPIQTQGKSWEALAVISVCGSYRLACYSQKILLSRSLIPRQGSSLA